MKEQGFNYVGDDEATAEMQASKQFMNQHSKKSLISVT